MSCYLKPGYLVDTRGSCLVHTTDLVPEVLYSSLMVGCISYIHSKFRNYDGCWTFDDYGSFLRLCETYGIYMHRLFPNRHVYTYIDEADLPGQSKHASMVPDITSGAVDSYI